MNDWFTQIGSWSWESGVQISTLSVESSTAIGLDHQLILSRNGAHYTRGGVPEFRQAGLIIIMMISVVSSSTDQHRGSNIMMFFRPPGSRRR